MSKRRVAIIGAGHIVRRHIEAIQANSDRLELVAISDINEERVNEVAGLYSVPNAYTDNSAMLKQEKPDLVHIITPPATHKALVIESLEAGAWVYCEKPLCGSLAEFDAMTETEEKTGRYVTNVFQYRFGSMGKHIKKLIETNALGRPLVAVCNTTWYRPQSYYDVPWRGKFETEFGGPTVTLGIHLTDFLLWLYGDWTEVRAMTGTLERNIQVEDVAMAQVRFESGAMGSIINSALCPRQESYLRLDFQKATLEASFQYFYSNEHWKFGTHPDLEDPEVRAHWESLSEDVAGTHEAQLAEILDHMDANTRPLVSGKEARRIIEYNASLYKSAATGQAVAQGSITADDPFYYSNNGTPEKVGQV